MLATVELRFGVQLQLKRFADTKVQGRYVGMFDRGFGSGGKCCFLQIDTNSLYVGVGTGLSF